MYADKLMTPEEQEKFVKEIWETNKKEALNHIEYAIRAEMQSSMTSMSKTLVRTELQKILAPMIAAQEASLTAAAEKIVVRLGTKLEAETMLFFRNAFASGYNNWASRVIEGLQQQLRGVMEKVLTYDPVKGGYVEVGEKNTKEG